MYKHFLCLSEESDSLVFLKKNSKLLYKHHQIHGTQGLFHYYCSSSETVASGERLFYSISPLLSTRGGEHQLSNFLRIGNEMIHDAVSAINNCITQPSSISSSHRAHILDNMYTIWSCLCVSALRMNHQMRTVTEHDCDHLDSQNTIYFLYQFSPPAITVHHNTMDGISLGTQNLVQQIL